ncbi:MAG: hypothetical protein ACOX8S_06695 [Christensenellales bacterium]|jgi:hypothetical protein
MLFMLLALAVLSSCEKTGITFGKASFTYKSIIYSYNGAILEELPKGTRVYSSETGRYLFICYVEVD